MGLLDCALIYNIKFYQIHGYTYLGPSLRAMHFIGGSGPLGSALKAVVPKLPLHTCGPPGSLQYLPEIFPQLVRGPVPANSLY